MKRFILVLICVIGFNMQAQNTSYNWSDDYKTVLKEAKIQDKFIVLYFSDVENSEGSAKMQSEIFETNTFKSLSSKAILLQVNSGTSLSNTQSINNKRLLGHYNSEGTFPKLLVLNSKGEVLGEALSQMDAETIESFLNFLKSI